jgi:hypothetical protein
MRDCTSPTTHSNAPSRPSPVTALQPATRQCRAPIAARSSACTPAGARVWSEALQDLHRRQVQRLHPGRRKGLERRPAGCCSGRPRRASGATTMQDMQAASRPRVSAGAPHAGTRMPIVAPCETRETCERSRPRLHCAVTGAALTPSANKH